MREPSKGEGAYAFNGVQSHLAEQAEFFYFIFLKRPLGEVYKFIENQTENISLRVGLRRWVAPVLLGRLLNEKLAVVSCELHKKVSQVNVLEEALLGLLVVAVAGVTDQGVVVRNLLIEVAAEVEAA